MKKSTMVRGYQPGYVRGTFFYLPRPRRKLGMPGSELAPAEFDAPTLWHAREHGRPTSGIGVPALSIEAAHDQATSLLSYRLDTSLPLPPALDKLLGFHAAVEQSLLLHMATNGACAAVEPDDVKGSTVRLPAIVPYSQLRPMVERISGRSFDSTEFRRLVWVWSHADHVPGRSDDEDTGGLGFLVSRVRSIDAYTRRRTYDWALGLEIPKHDLVSKSGDASWSREKAALTSSSPVRQDMSYVGAWSQGSEARHAEVSRRLVRWVAALHAHWCSSTDTSLAMCLDKEPVAPQPTGDGPPKTPTKPRGGYTVGDAGIMTPSASRPDQESHATRMVSDMSTMSPPTSPLAYRAQRRAPPPRASTPPPSKPFSGVRLVRWHPDFALDAIAPIPLAHVPSLAAPAPAPTPQPAAVPPASAAPAAQGLSLEERIRAKEQARAAQASTGASTAQERAVLSRLPALADTLYMLYANSSAPAATSSQGVQTRILPLPEVLASLESANSAVLSRSEGMDCLKMLSRIVPDWLEHTKVGSQTWLRLRFDPVQGTTLRDVRAKIQRALAAAKARA